MRRLILALFTGLAALAWAGPTMPTVEVKPLAQGGRCSLAVKADVKAAAVYLDYSLIGQTPATASALVPGGHTLIVRKDGYKDFRLPLSLAPDTLTTVMVFMEALTGFLSVQADRPEAFAVVDGVEYRQGVLQLPAGRRSVTVRAFGYVDREYAVLIPVDGLVALNVSMEPASFSAGGYALSWTRFNPRNAGARGQLRVSYDVSAPGRAETLVIGPDGSVAFRHSDGPFSDWRQSFSWSGRADDGTPVPDGVYRILTTAVPEPGIASERDSFAMEAAVTVDSGMIVTPRGSWSAVQGSVNAPDAFAPPADSAGVAVGAFFRGAATGAYGGASVELTLSREGLMDFGLGLEANTGGSLGAAYAAARLALPPRMALALDGRLADAAPGRPSWLRLSLPLALGSPFLNLTLAPSASVRWEDAVSARAGLGLSLNYSTYGLAASVSAQVSSAELAGAPALAWPLSTAAELRFIPAGSPLVLRVFAGVDWIPENQPVGGWNAGLSLWGGL